MTFGFANPWALLLLLAFPAYALATRGHRPRALTFSRTSTLARLGVGAPRWLARLPRWLRGAGLASLVLALAGPRTGVSAMDVETEGIAIVVAVDISSSMLAEDFHPRNRLAVAKEKVAGFIEGRPHDRIGMVAFAGEALTQVPLTTDHPVLYSALDGLEVGQLEDGTAIGTAIATGANRLRRVAGPSRVMIVMTDGENNRGEIDPLTAARAAAAYDIRIYTIGVGSEGMAPIPVAQDLFGGYRYANLPVHIDDELLTEVAEATGGRYFRATNEEALDSIYGRIDALEKTTIRERRWVDYTPRYLPFVLLAALVLAGEWVLRGSRWGRVP